MRSGLMNDCLADVEHGAELRTHRAGAIKQHSITGPGSVLGECESRDREH
jgi:hypothetical protein